MYDTIRLHDRHPEVEIGSRFHKCARAGSAQVKTGRVLQVKGADGSLVHLRHSRLWCDDIVVVTASEHGLFITTSAARDPRTPTAPNVSPPRSPEELAERLDLIERHLAEIGLRVNLRECSLSRVDCCRDVVLEQPYGDLMPALEARDLQRLSPADLAAIAPFDGGPGAQSKKPLDEHTYGRTWTEHALVIYSKSAHVAGKRRYREYAAMVAAELRGRPVIRFEHRCRKKRAVKGKLRIERGADLVTEWDAIEATFANTIADTLGEPADPVGVGGLSKSTTTRLEELADSGFGRGQKRLIADLALRYLEKELRAGTLDIEGLRAQHSSAGMRKCDLDKALGDLMQHVRNEGRDLVMNAIDELRLKLASDPYAWPSPDVRVGGQR